MTQDREPRALADPHPSEVLTEQEWTRDVQTPPRSGVLAAVSNAMVGMKKQFYGKGPVRAKSYANDAFLFCVLDGGLTRNEETLLEAGQHELVRQYRLAFQTAMTQTVTETIERLTGRRLLTYHSQIVFDPPRTFEIFVLDEPL